MGYQRKSHCVSTVSDLWYDMLHVMQLMLTGDHGHCLQYSKLEECKATQQTDSTCGDGHEGTADVKYAQCTIHYCILRPTSVSAAGCCISDHTPLVGNSSGSATGVVSMTSTMRCPSTVS